MSKIKDCAVLRRSADKVLAIVVDGAYRGRRIMKFLFVAAILISGCASWHWEKGGASAVDYAADEKFCKLQAYSGTDGMVTQAHVRRMHDCLAARGWKKVAN